MPPASQFTIVQAGEYQRIESIPTSQHNGTKITIKKCHIRDRSSRTTEKDPEPPVDFTVTNVPDEHKNHSDESKNHNQQSTEVISNATATSTFTCDVCKQSITTKRGLTVHRSRHANEANATTASQLSARLTKTNTTDPNDKEATKNGVSTENVQSVRAALDSECNTWQKTFQKYESSADLDIAAFEEDMTKFMKFLFKANQRLPGPQHPSVKFYRLRQQKRNRKNMSAQQSRSSNPQRTDAKTKQRRRDKYQYDLSQYWYYNQRKKAVRAVMSSGSTKQCKIKMTEMENHFKNVFENMNDHVLEHYPSCEINENISVNEDDIKIQMKKTKLDTSAGPDRILVKTSTERSKNDFVDSQHNADHIICTGRVP